jgi:hypothetical protein
MVEDLSGRTQGTKMISSMPHRTIFEWRSIEKKQAVEYFCSSTWGEVADGIARMIEVECFDAACLVPQAMQAPINSSTMKMGIGVSQHEALYQLSCTIQTALSEAERLYAVDPSVSDTPHDSVPYRTDVLATNPLVSMLNEIPASTDHIRAFVLSNLTYGAFFFKGREFPLPLGEPVDMLNHIGISIIIIPVFDLESFLSLVPAQGSSK